ncbi:hypothetical protein M231_01086 [Tremella mesenterica]|uniref:Dynamin N-terminal domain-containing protein n=1 Tax=Tremella mesenterica TaxID=5217 RepID=A0A4V1M4U5_TREME|nr:hypothetical protein M231_01086 [Tremella mesenterica]
MPTPPTPESPARARPGSNGLLIDPQTPSPTRTRRLEPDQESDMEDDLDAVFAVHDLLINSSDILEGIDKLPVTKFVTIGGQSAGKSMFLSCLLNINLWSEYGTTATFGPTMIHSRFREAPFEASIEIEFLNPAPGKPRKVLFTTEPLRNSGEVREALRLAGNEARRSRDGMIRVRTLETLSQLSDDERLRGSGSLPKFTDNVVTLHVSGPDQRNATVVDLPGLIGGDDGPKVEAFAELYLADLNNIAILCLAAGGADPSFSAREIQLVKKHRPQGQMVAGIITKADYIELPAKSSFIQLAHDEYPHFQGFKAEYKWSIVRLKTADENVQNRTYDETRHAERELFAERRWAAVKERGLATLGMDATKDKLFKIFARLAKEDKSKLPSLLEERKTEARAKLSALPSEEARPIGALHDLINETVSVLRTKLYKTDKYTKMLCDSQRQFGTSLKNTIPICHPVLNTAAESISADDTVPSTPDGTGQQRGPATLASQADLWLDDVLSVVRKKTSARDGTCYIDECRLELTLRTTSLWTEICLTYIGETWKIVDLAIKEVLGGICEKEALRRKVVTHLTKLQKMYRDRTKERLDWLCARERQGRELLDLLDDDRREVFRTLVKHLFDRFNKTYHTKLLEQSNDFQGLARRSAPLSSPRSTSAASQVSDSDAEGDSIWTKVKAREVRRAIEVQGGLTVCLNQAAQRILDVVGREGQATLLDYLDGAICALRQGFDLENTVEMVTKRTRDMFEADADTVEMRNKQKRLLESINELEDPGLARIRM